MLHDVANLASARRLLLRRARATAACVALAWALGCGEDKPEPPPTPPGAGLLGGEEVWVRHITIQYAGARGAPRTVTRSKPAADSLARALRSRLLERGADFAALAREFSDDASAADGGEIAPLQAGDTPPEFEQAAKALPPGQLSEIVESPYGFHIIQRRSREKASAQHILVRYAGAANCPDSITRGRAEAMAMAEKILNEVRNPNVSFPVAAYNYSEDEATATRGGNVGEFIRGTLHPKFEEAVFALGENEISGVVETPYGFHVIRRVKALTIRVSHILVTYSGSQNMDQISGRTKDEALQRAADVLFRARKGEDFAALAREYSEDTVTAKHGGRMPRIDRGQMVPQFEDAAFSLEPGQISDIVETEFGFHIIKRLY